MPERFDIGALRAPERMPNGMMRGDANLTRIGVFHYMKADGTKLRELRKPEQVFHPDSLQSFRMVPVTNNHPPVEVTAANAKEFAVGCVSDNIHRDGDFVRSSLMLFDGRAVSDVESGKVELSCGYSCDLDFTPGTWNGEPYDAIQRNIRGNHVAIVDKGRAGPEVKIRMDSQGGVMVPKTKDAQMEEIVIGGKKYQVSAEVAAQIMKLIPADAKPIEPADAAKPGADGNKAQGDRADKAELDRVTKERDTLKAQIDAGKNDKAAKDREDTIRADERNKVQARIALVTKARSVLGAEWKDEAKTDEAIRLEIVKHFDAETDFTGKSGDYIEARIDAEMKRVEKSNPALDAAREAANGGKPGPARADAASGDKETKARADMLDTNHKRGVEPIHVGRSKK